MTDLTITISVNGAVIDTSSASAVHACGPDCDCPVALARTQYAIDAARDDDDRPARPLSVRLHAMRNATPSPQWFEIASADAAQLETRTVTSPGTPDVTPDTPGRAFAVMHDAAISTLHILELADLIPCGHEIVRDSKMGDFIVWVGSLKLVIGMTGVLDTPSAAYIVTTSDDAQALPGVERFADNLDTVRAWLTAWAVSAAVIEATRPPV